MSSGRVRRAKAAIFIGFTLLLLGFALSYYAVAEMTPSSRASGVLGAQGRLRLNITGSHEKVYYLVNSTGRSGNITLTFYDTNGSRLGVKTFPMGAVEKGSVTLEGEPSYAVATCTSCEGVTIDLYYSTFDRAYTALLSIAGAASSMLGIAASMVGVHVYMDERGLYLEDKEKKKRRKIISASS